MEPRYVLFRTPAGCFAGFIAALTGLVVCAIACALGLPKWAWVLTMAPPVGLVLAIALVLDRRRVDSGRPSAPEGPFGCSRFAIFLFVSVVSGALVIAWLTPMMKQMSGLGRMAAFLLGIGVATVFSRGILGIIERMSGENGSRE